MLGARSYRKRPLFRAPTPTREQERASSPSVSSRVSRGSTTSVTSKHSRKSPRKSLGGTIARRKSHVSVHAADGLVEGKFLKIREWLLILIEIFISFAAWVIRERNNNVEELIRVGLTVRENSIYMLYWQGWAAFGSWFAGVLADSYIGHYNLALFSVGLHFVVVSIVFMEDTIKGNQKGNPYAQLVWSITAISTLLLKSTDFTRLIFGLDGMGNRTKPTITWFIFLISWVGNHTYGGLIINLSGCVPYPIYVKMSFFASGVCLYLYVYVLRPARKQEYTDVSIRVVRCFIIACFSKCLKKKRRRKGWLDGAEGRCDTATIEKAKEMWKFYAMLFPTIGYAFCANLRLDLFYVEYFKSLKSYGMFRILGVVESTRLIVLTSSLMTYLCVWPLFLYSTNRKDLYYKFFAGFLAGIVAIYYASMSLCAVEHMQFPKNMGYVRIFNTRKSAVSVSPLDSSFSTHSYSIAEEKASMIAYPIPKISLYPVRLQYHGTKVNFSVYLSVQPEQSTGYIILEPPDIVRINGLIPIMEGPPGTNIGSNPRLYLFNTVKTLTNAVFSVKGSNENKIFKECIMKHGKMTVFQLPPGSYDFMINEAGIKKTFKIKQGAIYGVLSYADITSRSIIIDEVRSENKASPYMVIPLAIFSGLANCLGTVALLCLTHATAPQGLLGMSFAFMSFLENITCFILYIGYRTWHVYVTSFVSFAYSFVVTIFFFLTVFIFIKYKTLYEW